MYISADACLFPSYHKRDLTVSLQSYQTVDNMAACFFKHFRPYNVVFLIESCFQFNQHGNLFAIFGSLCERRNYRGMTADTIQSLLDCKYAWILRRLTDKIHNRIKTHIWMMQEYIAFTNHFKNIFVILELRNRCRCIFRALVLIKSVQTVNFHQHSQIQRSRNIINVCIFDLEFFFQNVQQTFIHLFFCFKTNHLAPLAFLELFLNFYQKIFCLILINRKICISHDSVRMCADHIIAQEKFADVSFNNLFEKNYRSLTFLYRRDLDDSRKDGRHLNSCKFQFFCMLFIVFLCNQCTDIQCLITDQRKWSGRIHCHRCQYRINVIFKITVYKFCLFIIQIFVFCHQMKADLFQCRKHRTVERTVLHTYQLMGLCADFL